MARKWPIGNEVPVNKLNAIFSDKRRTKSIVPIVERQITKLASVHNESCSSPATKNVVWNKLFLLVDVVDVVDVDVVMLLLLRDCEEELEVEVEVEEMKEEVKVIGSADVTTTFTCD